MTSIDHNTPIPAKSLAEIEDRNERALKVAEDPAWSLNQAEFDRAMLCAEVRRLRTPSPPGELRGLESMCAALHAAAETDPVVKEVAWRTFALIRAHREQAVEVDRLKTALANEEATTDRLVGERDDMEKLLDKFAYTIAPEEVIGEHSSGNDPWENALDLLTPAAEVDRLSSERDRLALRVRETETAYRRALDAAATHGAEAALSFLADYVSGVGGMSSGLPDGGETRG